MTYFVGEVQARRVDRDMEAAPFESSQGIVKSRCRLVVPPSGGVLSELGDPKSQCRVYKEGRRAESNAAEANLIRLHRAKQMGLQVEPHFLLSVHLEPERSVVKA